MERQKKIIVVVACVPLLAFSAWRIVPFLFEQGITDRWESPSVAPPKKAGPAPGPQPDGTATEGSSSK